MLHDTIAAISSSHAPVWRGIIRLSGPDAHALARSHIATKSHVENEKSKMEHALLAPPLPPLPVMLLLFTAPRSFTGQDVAELHLPGAPPLLNMLLESILRAGARQAGPGEFTARAFFHGKMDLTQAEGIAATIAAANDRQLRAAASLREGLLHRWVARLAEKLAQLLARIEAGIDFSDEEGVSFLTVEQCSDALLLLFDGISDWVQRAVRLDRLDVLPNVVFIGEPNVGKSSLINALAGHQRSIVSPIAGTTRDMLSVVMHTDRGDIRLVDVPGEEPATDELRSKMMQARETALLDADWIIHVVTHPTECISGFAGDSRYPGSQSTVQNKADLLPRGNISLTVDDEGETLPARFPWQLVSAQTGLHLEELRERIADAVLLDASIDMDRLVLNQRHRLIFHQVKESLDHAIRLLCNLTRHPELLAAELRHALDLLGEITEVISPDEILGRIFSSFCIGK